MAPERPVSKKVKNEALRQRRHTEMKTELQIFLFLCPGWQSQHSILKNALEIYKTFKL